MQPLESKATYAFIAVVQTFTVKVLNGIVGTVRSDSVSIVHSRTDAHRRYNIRYGL
jgi:hypothetical protein